MKEVDVTMAEKSSKSVSKRRRPDWSVVKRQYETGQHSLRALAKLHGISEGAIRKKRDRFGWTCKLSAAVKERTRQKLVQQLAAKVPKSKGTQGTHFKSTHSTRRSRKSAPDPDAGKTLERIEAEREATIENASTHKAAVVTYHQKCLRTLIESANVIGERCKQSLEDPAGFDEKKYPFRGKRESVSDALKKCADIEAKLIPLERQAYDLDQISEDEAAGTLLEAYMRFKAEREAKSKDE